MYAQLSRAQGLIMVEQCAYQLEFIYQCQCQWHQLIEIRISEYVSDGFRLLLVQLAKSMF
jgi:hypothetical protein